MLALSYIAIAFGGLTALCIMILRIGVMVGTCPATGTAARAAAVTIATGLAAIGAGGVILIGAVLPLNPGHYTSSACWVRAAALSSPFVNI